MTAGFRQPPNRLPRLAWLLALLLLASGSSAAFADAVDFRRDVWSIIQSRCLECHGPDKQRSSLRLDSRTALLQGGDHGPAVVSGDPAASRLIAMVTASNREERMPPKG